MHSEHYIYDSFPAISAVLTIRIDDLNDNPPEFALGTLQETRFVTEMGDAMSTIGKYFTCSQLQFHTTKKVAIF